MAVVAAVELVAVPLAVRVAMVVVAMVSLETLRLAAPVEVLLDTPALQTLAVVVVGLDTQAQQARLEVRV